MMNETGLRRTLPDQLSGSGHTFDTAHHPSIINTIPSKRVCFYKSGDPQFNGLRMVINNRTFKTFDALLDSLSKKVPLAFGVRNITTPRGVHGISTLDELEDGKSYLCSDSRKVKPFNLALARRKLPPWYHTTPLSSRHRTEQQARFFPGRKNIPRQEPFVVRTPKKIVVFRNGNPSVKHTVVLHKKTSPRYESILEHISELMQFHVNKLHTPDGRRVDGLPGLILCSGTVVAVGREPFRPAVYRVQTSPTPTRQNTNRGGFRRQKISNSEKKSPSYSSKSRNFSASSERYIVRQIQSSIAEGSCDLPSNLANSVELDSNCMLDSIAEREDTWHGHGAEGQDCSLLNDDNIEKSFRVNQDGSMTVEMKVRLTIKEEETVQWTTTLTRSAAADQLNVAPDSETQLEINSNKSDSHKSQSSAASDTIHKEDHKYNIDDDEDDPPPLGSGDVSGCRFEEDDVKNHTDVSPRRVPTPGLKQISKQQASAESIKTVTMNGTADRPVGSYSYREQIEIERCCVVNQDGPRPVPKPRRLGSIDVKSRDNSDFKSSEIIQTESDGDEVTETVLHIYEQQTCLDNFLANVCSHGMAGSEVIFEQATKAAGQLSTMNEESESWGPSTESKPVGVRRADGSSSTSDLNLLPLQTNVTQREKSKNPVKPQQKEVVSVSPKSKLIDKHVQLVVMPRKRPKMNSKKVTERRKRVKPFSSAAFIKRIYGKKSKSAKKSKMPNQKPIRKGATMKSLPEPATTVSANATDSNISFKKKTSKTGTELGHPRGTLTRQISMHMEKKEEKESSEISKSMSLPPFNSSSSMTKEYVENWLEKAHLHTTSHSDRESQKSGAFSLKEPEMGGCGERKEEIQTCKTRKSPQENELAPSVKLRILSFENKSNTSVEKTEISNTTTAKLDNYNGLSQKNTPPLPPTDTLPEKVLGGEVENPVTPTDSLTMALPPPPPELLNNESFTPDVPSAGSSPFYRLSSMSSHISENYPFTMSPTSNKGIELGILIENTTPVQTDNPSTLQEAELSRTQSIKRAPLVSNGSLERKMSLRRASLDKYTSGIEATLGMTTLSPPISTVGDEVPTHGICSMETEPPLKAPFEETLQSVLDPSVCTSMSPASLISDERQSMTSVLSIEAPISSNIQPKKTTMAKIPQKEAPSPKTLIKRTQLKRNPSPEMKIQSKLPPVTKRLSDKVVLPKIGIQKHSMPNVSSSTQKKLQRASPSSQSLDVLSPPARHKYSRKFLSRNVSLDNPPESMSKTQKKMPSKHVSQMQEMETPAAKMEADHNWDNEADWYKSVADTKEKLQPSNIANQPSMKPVLENICYSIKSIRQITQNKRPSCLEKSNSLPDFSSHVASTFGSSSKALLAFLAVMTLREGLTNLNVDELNANNLSCAEALKMIDSLREIANIEDSQGMKTSLSNLQQSTSKQLLQSWKGFQELGDRRKSRGSTPNASAVGLTLEDGTEQDCGIAEIVIDEIIDNLDIPEKLKEELASLSESTKSDSDNEGKISKGVNERTEASATQDTPENTNYFPSEDATSKDDVRTIIKKLTEMESFDHISETAKHKTTDQTSGNNSSQDESDFVTERPSAEGNFKQIPDERQVYRTTSINLQPSGDVAHQEEQNQQQGNKHEKSTQANATTCEEMSSETKLKDSCVYKTEKQYLELRQLTLKTEDIVSETTRINKKASDADKGGQKIASANKDMEKNCKEVSEAGEKSCSGNATKVERDTIIQDNSKSEDLSSPESRFEETQTSANYYVEVNFKENRESTTKSKKLSEEPENKCKASESLISSMGLNISTDDSTGHSDSEDVSSEEDQPVVDSKKLQVIIEESFSPDEDGEAIYNGPNVGEQTTKSRRGLEALREETEEEQASSSEEHHNENPKSQSTLDGVQSSEKNERDLILSDVVKDLTFNADDDSGHDHSSCEEHGDELTEEDEHINSSTEELSYYEKQSNSEEGQGNIEERYTRETSQLQEVNLEQFVENPLQRSAENITQSVAERVNLLEKQVAEAQKVNNTSSSLKMRRFSQRKAHVELEDSPSESPTSDPILCTRSAPQSSLSFSYDSSGVITTEPESSRVRSIKEMFLAKSATDIQQRQFPSPHSSDLPDVRPEASGSGGYQSQTSGEQSSGEDDSSRKSIGKGFVRRTIEMLYGKKEIKPEKVHERPPSEPSQRKKEPSIFSPFHAVRAKAMSELSSFSSTNALDSLSEATRCIAFNVQVGPGDTVPIHDGCWLLGENTVMRKSVSDPVGINKTFSNSPDDEGLGQDTEVSSPYSLFSTKPELEDKTKTPPRKCTYFSLPHTSESEVCQEDQSTASKNGINGDDPMRGKDTSEDTKTWAGRNGILPSVGVPEFKMKDNKVHPLVELPPEGEEVVVVQPGRGQGVVIRRVEEADVLDLLYHFCGEHCPIL
ncbi:uncharacterized protein [Nothobranchius furzeri]